MSVIVPYYQMNALLVNAYKVNVSNVWGVSDLSVTFEEYVKSQIHFNMLSSLFGRQYKIYLKSYKFLQGNTEFYPSFVKTIFWFYDDIANSIKNCMPSMDLDIDLTLDTSFIERTMDTTTIYLDEFYDELLSVQRKEERDYSYDYYVMRKLTLEHEDVLGSQFTNAVKLVMALLYSVEKGEIVCLRQNREVTSSN